MWNVIKLFINKCLILLFVFPVSSHAAERIINAWTYYDMPPFVTGEGQGLVYDFVELLNGHVEGDYQFQVMIYPRKRLDSQLEEGEQGIVLFVNWAWMGENAKTKYLWGPVILTDRNEIISGTDRRVEFDGSAGSLKGLLFGGLLGRRYPGLMVAMERKEIIRVNARTEVQNLKKILHQRIDVTTMPQSQLGYHIKNMQLDGQLHLSETPLFSYSRHLLVTKKLQSEYAFITAFTKGLSGNNAWRIILQKYGLSQSQ